MPLLPKYSLFAAFLLSALAAFGQTEGAYDPQGAFIFEQVRDSSGENLYNALTGKFVLRRAGKMGVADSMGNLLVPFEYEIIILEDSAPPPKDSRKPYDPVYSYPEAAQSTSYRNGILRSPILLKEDAPIPLHIYDRIRPYRKPDRIEEAAAHGRNTLPLRRELAGELLNFPPAKYGC